MTTTTQWNELHKNWLKKISVQEKHLIIEWNTERVLEHGWKVWKDVTESERWCELKRTTHNTQP